MNRSIVHSFSLVLVEVLICTTGREIADAATFFAPTPYVSTADIPVGFYNSGSPTFLEDFEDGSLDGGITGSPALGAGALLGSDFGTSLIDSVDADDGLINGLSSDGAGNFGDSYWTPGAVRFTFGSPLPTAAGLVWTDGATSGEQVTLEAFGPGLVSLGTFGPFSVGDGNNLGGSAEDRFFGVQDLGGILAISLTSLIGALEVDHVQYGVVPEPSTFVLCALVGMYFVATTLRRP